MLVFAQPIAPSTSPNSSTSHRFQIILLASKFLFGQFFNRSSYYCIVGWSRLGKAIAHGRCCTQDARSCTSHNRAHFQSLLTLTSPCISELCDISSHVLRKTGRTRIDTVSETRGGVRFRDQVRHTYTALTPPQPYVNTLGLVRAIPPPPPPLTIYSPPLKPTPAALIRFPSPTSLESRLIILTTCSRCPDTLERFKFQSLSREGESSGISPWGSFSIPAFPAAS